MRLQLTRPLLTVKTSVNNMDIVCRGKYILKQLFNNKKLFLFFFKKAIEDEDGDPEDIQIQPSTDGSSRKGGKSKGNFDLI